MFSLDFNLSIAAIVVLIFMSGLLSSLSPCTLPTILFASAYVTSETTKKTLQPFITGLFFVLGMITVLTSLGYFASMIGLLLNNTTFFHYIIAFVLITMGLWLLKVIQFSTSSTLMSRLTFTKGWGYLGAYILGLPFGIIASPCTLPITASVLAYSATHKTPLIGAFLMFVFALGRSIPLLTLVTFTSFLTRIERFRPIQLHIEKISGIIVILIGYYYLWIA
jgi:cytochrome c-type biogenesis protein